MDNSCYELNHLQEEQILFGGNTKFIEGELNQELYEEIFLAMMDVAQVYVENSTEEHIIKESQYSREYAFYYDDKQMLNRINNNADILGIFLKLEKTLTMEGFEWTPVIFTIKHFLKSGREIEFIACRNDEGTPFLALSNNGELIPVTPMYLQYFDKHLTYYLKEFFE